MKRPLTIRTAKYFLHQEKLGIEGLGHALECLAWIHRLIYHLEDTKATDKDVDLREITDSIKLGLGSLIEALSQLAFDREDSMRAIIESMHDDTMSKTAKAACLES